MKSYKYYLRRKSGANGLFYAFCAGLMHLIMQFIKLCLVACKWMFYGVYRFYVWLFKCAAKGIKRLADTIRERNCCF